MINRLIIFLFILTIMPAVTSEAAIKKEIDSSQDRVKVVFSVSSLNYPNPRSPPLIPSERIGKCIRVAANRHNVDPLLIRAIIQHESNYISTAVSSTGAQGLMQIMPGTAKDLRIVNPFDPSQNIEAGTKYFRSLLNLYKGDVVLSLAAYNAGPRNIHPSAGILKFSKAKTYASNILKNYETLKSQQ